MGNKISKAVERSQYTDELDISYLELSSIPQKVSTLINITLLNAAGNKIKSIDSLHISRLTHLQHLDLSGNKLQSFPLSIIKLKSLKTLNISFNAVKVVPPEIPQLSQLETLNISGNSIGMLPDEIGTMTTLKELVIEKNKLTDIPLTFERLTLTRIAVKGNPWTKVPIALAKMEGPEELNFSDGEVSELGVDVIMAFSQNKTLKVVDLSKNRIRKVPPELTELYVLREVILKNNPIKEWPDRVKSMMNLTYNFDDELKAQLWVK